MDTHTTLTTLTTLTKPATARDCAVRVPPSRADHPDHLRPPPGSLVARIVEAGGTSRIGGAYKTAEIPADCPAALTAELEREGWCIVRVAAADPAEWAGEYEDALPPAPDHGDEAEHDAWLLGTPAADLWPAS